MHIHHSRDFSLSSLQSLCWFLLGTSTLCRESHYRTQTCVRIFGAYKLRYHSKCVRLWRPTTQDPFIICHCLSVLRPYLLKRMKNKIAHMVYITKTVYYKVSCGVVVGSVLKATWTGVGTLKARCVSCRVSHLIFAPPLGYIDCPDVRVRHRLPR